MLGSILSGMTDGRVYHLWTSTCTPLTLSIVMYSIEGPIITAYPEPALRGRMLGLWVTLRNLYVSVLYSEKCLLKHS